jgi:hypothetical protein
MNAEKCDEKRHARSLLRVVVAADRRPNQIERPRSFARSSSFRPKPVETRAKLGGSCEGMFMLRIRERIRYVDVRDRVIIARCRALKSTRVACGFFLFQRPAVADASHVHRILLKRFNARDSLPAFPTRRESRRRCEQKERVGSS